MTTEEKLKHFLDTCMEDARDRSARMLDEYMSALEMTLEEHQEDAWRRAQMQIRLESEKMQRALNKQLAIEHISIKRDLGHKQEELKEKLFMEVNDMLANFMATPEYYQLLENQIQQAVTFAGDDNIVIYLDPADESKARDLSLAHSKTQILISEYSFSGGTRAVIPSRHILIDNSFQTKLAEAKENFHFDLSLTTGGSD